MSLSQHVVVRSRPRHVRAEILHHEVSSQQAGDV